MSLRTTHTHAVAFAAVLGLVVSLIPSGRLTAATPSAANVVRAIYRDHFSHNQRWDITFKRHRAQLASSLLAAFKVDDDWADAHPDEVPNLDGDPLTSSQEMSNGYSVGAATRDGSDEVVPVKIRLGPETRTVRVRLTLERGTWCIANIFYDEGPDLVAILTAPHE